jgi:hypothetical protein
MWRLVNKHALFGGDCCHHLRVSLLNMKTAGPSEIFSERGGNKFLRNTVTYLSKHTIPFLRRPLPFFVVYFDYYSSICSKKTKSNAVKKYRLL